jgi:hypothetical protein
MSRFVSIFVLCAFSVGLTVVFWLPLWQGGGFIGGDVYSYYLPQKTFYAERLQSGELPLWNNLTGHGYPLIAESQTGVFYPFHLLFYTTLDVNTAYNVNHLLHYVMAFLFCWMYARVFGLNRAAAALSALVYTYGWFPARNCLEWAIIGGAWLPLALWCVERFLKTRHWRYSIGLSVVLSMQMLAGHYNFGFITQILLVVYIPSRLWITRENQGQEPDFPHQRRLLGMTAAAILFGFALSAVQLIPTWELRRHSQRATVGEHHLLAQGSVPIGYWSQIVQPWKWYSVQTDRKAKLAKSVKDLGAPTNQVEAHLYFGLIPFGLMLLGIVMAVRRRNRKEIFWFLLGMAALFYASGLMIPLTQSLPGFNFFQGPGRWGLVTTLAVAILAGSAFQKCYDQQVLKQPVCWLAALLIAGTLLSELILVADTDLVMQQSRIQNPAATNPLTFSGWELTETRMGTFVVTGILAAMIAGLLGSGRLASRSAQGVTLGKGLLAGLVFAVTIGDFWMVSRLVTESPMIDDPPINHITESPVSRILSRNSESVRLWAPYANFPNVLGVSSVPVYLTFGPAVYLDQQLMIPSDSISDKTSWLCRADDAGVTHILSEEPLSSDEWPVELLWQGFDRMLNPAMGRFNEPLYLYKLLESRGRAAFVNPQAEGTARITDSRANRIVIQTNSVRDGRLVLTDLMYPGWTATIDGQPTKSMGFENMFRSVNLSAGRHTVVWTFKPQSVYWGALVSGIAVMILAAMAHIRFRHPGRLRFLDVNTKEQTPSNQESQ